MEREKDRSEGDFQPNSHKCQKLAFLFKLLCLICCGQVTQNVFRINFCIFAYVDIENPQCCWGSDQSLRKGGKFSNVPNKILSIMEVIQHQEEQTTWAADTGAAATCIQSCGQVRWLSGSFGSLRWDSAMKHPSFPSEFALIVNNYLRMLLLQNPGAHMQPDCSSSASPGPSWGELECAFPARLCRSTTACVC